MNKKAILIVVAVFLVVAFIGIVFVEFAFNQQKIEASNVKLGYGASSDTYIFYTVTNKYTSSLTSVEASINGADYGSMSTQLSPGQTENALFDLHDVVLSQAENYAVKLTFNFADGKSQDITQSLAGPTPATGPTPTVEPSATPASTSTNTPTPSESLVIIGVTANSNSSTIMIYAYSASHMDVVISSAIVKEQNGTVVGTDNAVSQTLPASGKYTTITIPAISTLQASSIYSVTLVTSDGNSFVSPSFMYS